MDYIYHLSVVVAIYGLLSASLELVAGRAGLVALCQAAFYGIGAFVAGAVSVRYQWDFPSSTMAGVAVAVICSLLVSLPALRLTGDYFAIATFGIQIVLWQAFNNMTGLTGGPMGISQIPPPKILGCSLDSPARFLPFAMFVAGVAWAVMFLMLRSPFGRVLLAIRESESFVRSLGRNPMRFKMQACAVSAGMAAVAGSLYARYSSYIDPGSFTLNESILVLAMVIIGGAGSVLGPWLGAAVLVVLPELLRFVGLPNAAAASLRQVMYGVCLVVMMLYRPRGLAGRYEFQR